MNRRVHVGLAAMVSFAVLSTSVEADAWREIHGEQFVLRSASAEDLRETACDLERIAHALRQIQLNTAPSLRDPVAVVAVHGERGVREFLPQLWERRGARPVGAYWSGPNGHHIVVRVDTGAKERFRRIRHEYAHFVTHLAYPEPPRWLDEGLSELWTNAAITQDAIEIGGPAKNNLKRLRAGKHWIPVPELLSARELPAPNDPRLRMFYAESWVLVHYLLFQNGDSLAFESLNRPARLPSDKDLRRYVAENPAFKGVKIPAPLPSACSAMTSRELSDVESLLTRAQALADGERPETALRLLDQLLKQDSNNAEALELVGVVHFSGNRPKKAAAVFDGIIESGRPSFVSFYYRAILADMVPEISRSRRPVPVGQYLQRALDLNPDFTPARERLRELKRDRMAADKER